jgi:hypothetical protein
VLFQFLIFSSQFLSSDYQLFVVSKYDKFDKLNHNHSNDINFNVSYKNKLQKLLSYQSLPTKMLKQSLKKVFTGLNTFYLLPWALSYKHGTVTYSDNNYTLFISNQLISSLVSLIWRVA